MAEVQLSRAAIAPRPGGFWCTASVASAGPPGLTNLAVALRQLAEGVRA